MALIVSFMGVPKRVNSGYAAPPNERRSEPEVGERGPIMTDQGTGRHLLPADHPPAAEPPMASELENVTSLSID